MKPASLKDLKDELKSKSPAEVLDICLALTKYKKENKELLTYLLFEAGNEDDYINEIKLEIAEQFSNLNTSSYYFVKKGVRKILRNAKKYIRYSKKKPTEIEVLLFYCQELKSVAQSYSHNTTLVTIYDKQVEAIQKKITTLHEDLQYDYNLMLEEL